jgi:hypothetical protein
VPTGISGAKTCNDVIIYLTCSFRHLPSNLAFLTCTTNLLLEQDFSSYPFPDVRSFKYYFLPCYCFIRDVLEACESSDSITFTCFGRGLVTTWLAGTTAVRQMKGPEQWVIEIAVWHCAVFQIPTWDAPGMWGPGISCHYYSNIKCPQRVRQSRVWPFEHWVSC